MNMNPDNIQAKKLQEPVSEDRSRDKQLDRRFFNKLSLALLGFASLLIGIPVIGFLVDPLFRPIPRLWRRVGAVDDFKVGDIAEVTFDDMSALPWAGLAGKTAAWLYRQGELDFVAYSANCSHLGCPVRWEANAQLVYVSLPRRCLLQERQCSGGTAAARSDEVPGARSEWPS